MSSPVSSIEKGNALEDQIYHFFSSEIAAHRLFAKPSCCKIRKKPRYYSRDRNNEIEFDVSIEIYLPGMSDFSFVVLIECKNYNKSVPVNDVEEFFCKVQQVAAANSKSIVASKGAFQASTLEFAKSKKIGLLRCFDQSNCKWDLLRSPSMSAYASAGISEENVLYGLSDDSYQSEFYDFYLQSPTRYTHSISDFFEDLLLDEVISPSQLRHILNPKMKRFEVVPFREKGEIEERASEILQALLYSDGTVPLEMLCAKEHENTGLVVRLETEPSKEALQKGILGRISFEPLQIEVFRQPEPIKERTRFTLAHELAHHLLGHGRYMRREYCQNSDFSQNQNITIEGSEVARMEFQANYLAAALLLPKHNIMVDFRNLLRTLDLPNRGHGQLYVDDQLCNLQNFHMVTTHMSRKYQTSHTATKIRLQELGLLQDHRKNQNAMHALDYL